MNYYPKRPIKSFQDLEVYQKALALSVLVSKKINLLKSQPLNEKLSSSALEIPVLIASAHSLRFGEAEKAIDFLEQAMLKCNLTIVYLEQVRDLFNEGDNKIEHEFFEEQVKALLSLRIKIMHLQWSWKKFMKLKREE